MSTFQILLSNYKNKNLKMCPDRSHDQYIKKFTSVLSLITLLGSSMWLTKSTIYRLAYIIYNSSFSHGGDLYVKGFCTSAISYTYSHKQIITYYAYIYTNSTHTNLVNNCEYTVIFVRKMFKKIKL